MAASLYNLKPHSWLYECTHVWGDGFFHAAKQHVEELTIKPAIEFHADVLCERVAQDRRTHNLTLHELFSSFKDIVREKTELSQAVDGNENVFSLGAAQQRKQSIQAGKIDLNKISVDELLERHKMLNPTPSTTINGAKIEEAVAKTSLSTAWEGLASREKAHVGIWAVGAALGAVFTVMAAQNTIVRDEEGKKHFVWSQAGVTLLQAAGTGLSGFMAHQVLHGRPL